MKTEQNQLLEEAVCYFKQRRIYEKIFRMMKQKYESLGHLGGTVVLTKLTKEEKADLSGFMQKDYTENKTISISVSSFEKAMRKSKFETLSLEQILTSYFREPLIGNKEKDRKEQEEKEQFFSEILSTCRESKGTLWLQKILRKERRGYELLMQHYRENRESLKAVLFSVLKAMDNLPVHLNREKKYAIPVFAAKITGDPHFFDAGTLAEKLMVLYLENLFLDQDLWNTEMIEKKTQLFFRAGLLKDDLSNDTLVHGIRAWKSEEELHMGIEGFFREKEPMRLTLRTLANVTCVKAREGKVYVVENPAVFSDLVERYPEKTIICSNGQPRLSTLLLMDLLAKSHEFYYAGDFDPEGLLIAQRLKERYQSKLKLWNYETKWYLQYMSNQTLSDMRLNKLKNLYLDELQEMKGAMLEQKKATYQEAMLEQLKNIGN